MFKHTQGSLNIQDRDISHSLNMMPTINSMITV
ncbi:MAG: CRISPR-associated DxTHG motif protein [Bacteroidaceae bacterium]|nr:CRISPR-associated DxTHG motif protein [Bacteroidaceae bacterium]